MKIISFGEYVKGKEYKVLNERTIRASAGILFLFALVAFINGFILKNYIVVPYIAGFFLFNFLIGVFINPKFVPAMFIGELFVAKQTPIYVGAIQKRFAWSLGILLSVAVFLLSLKLITDISFFEPVCMLCFTCLFLMFFETAFGICIGCKLYDLAIKFKIMKKPAQKPNCTGDSCEV